MQWRGRRTHEFDKFAGVCVSCWYLSEFESLAMWRLYGPIDGAIAMQSTIRNLWTSRRDKSRGHLSLIEYVADFELHSEIDFYRYRAIQPGTLKRKSFEHERELRFFSGEHGTSGAYCRVRLETLLDTVYVSPQSPMWFKDVVEGTLRAYGLPNVPVVQSRI